MNCNILKQVDLSRSLECLKKEIKDQIKKMMDENKEEI